MADPVTVITNLEDLSSRLDGLSKAQWKLEREFEPVAERWDDLWDDLLVSLVDRYEEGSKRMPGEEARGAMIRKQIRTEHPELYGKHRRLRAEIVRSERRANRIEKEISANQSILSWLRTEAQATT